ncbi:hypothetical protein J4481_01785 [Candidatus Pacearchaeota archaeon]|nr:hypothetical protein [uncultured archaeon]MBS3076452.1 hypothetical protein [Candidatus Pacearchaeota archaeon]
MTTKINTDNLEKALSKKTSEPQAPKMTKEQEVAFHQGALTTLNNERAELFKIIQNVELVMQAHIKRLEEMGIKIQTKK